MAIAKLFALLANAKIHMKSVVWFINARSRILITDYISPKAAKIPKLATFHLVRWIEE